jgi:NADPH:quinone reductase
MKAVRALGLGGPQDVVVADVPEPCVEDALLVDVHAAGISFPDLLLSRGEYQLKPDPPFTLGIELAGVVVDAPHGSGFSEGDRVAAFVAGGAFAERAAAMPQMTFRLPDQLSFEQGAAYVVNYHTAHFGLVRRARLAAGETLLVHGAAGGVGTAAIQVGKALGASVIGVVSTDDKERISRQAGADEVVRSDGWREALGGPVDVVYDPVGGQRSSESLRALAPEGRLLVIGFVQGSIPEIKLNRLLFRNVTVMGAGWGHFAAERPEYMREVAADLARMVAEGYVQPIVGQTYSFDQVPDALTAIAERKALGKLVLSIKEGR